VSWAGGWRQEHERAVGAARNRRMQRLVGETDQDDAAEILLSGEKLDASGGNTPRAMTPRVSDVPSEDAEAVKRQAMARSKSNAVLAVEDAPQMDEDADTEQYLQLWDVSPDMLQPVQEWLTRARQVEPACTKMLLDATERSGGRLSGLDYRLKTKASMARKVLEKTQGDSAQFESFCAKQNDWVRYTVVLSTDTYVEGVHNTVAALCSAGLTQHKMKNFWRKSGEETDYMGINSVFLTPSMAFPVEVQFHTPETLDTKMQRCHHSYEKFREEQSMTKAQVNASCATSEHTRTRIHHNIIHSVANIYAQLRCTYAL
jgi:hypothetical protein